MRQIGIDESNIMTAVSLEPRLLYSHMEKNWIPNVAKLQLIGLYIEDISRIIIRCPKMFQSNIMPKIDFLMHALGSLENVSVVLKTEPNLLVSKLEKVIMSNLSFVEKQCDLSVRQIVQLIKSVSRLITSSPEAMKIKVKRAEKLGFSCSSPTFLYASIVVGYQNKNTLNSKIRYLKSMGLPQEEISSVISKALMVLNKSDELLGRKMEFLMKEAGCGKIDVVRNPVLFDLSLEKWLIPRNLVRKLLKSKEFPVANKVFSSLAKSTEQQFVKKFVLPYQHAFLGLLQAHVDVCAEKIAST